MADLHHIYVTAHGEWTTTAWVGEKAQFGLRLPMAARASDPEKGTVWTPIANGEVVVDSGTQAGTNGTLTRFWEARIGPVGSVDNADAAMQADLGDDIWTFLNATKSLVYSGFRWTHVKIAPVAAGGAYAAPSAIYTFTTPLVGTSVTGAQPPEVALAVSLRAPVIGRRGRGRIYLPALGLTGLGTDGTVNSTASSTAGAAMATLIANLDNPPGTEDYGPRTSVMSANSTTAVRPSQVRVGNHYDVQRRRQHQVVETYTTTAL